MAQANEGDGGCCGTGPWLGRRGLGKRALLLCAALPASVAAAPAPYPPLPQKLVFHQVPGAPVHYTLGHPAIPDAANEGNTTNAGFVVTDEGVLVFDTLGTPSLGWAMLEEIRRVTDKPVRFVVTSHYHADHIYGLQAFRDHTDAVIVAQREALEYTAPGNIDDEKAIPRLEQRRQALAPWVNASTRIVLPRLVFREAAEIRLGGKIFRMNYAGPAHSMSDMMMEVLPDRVLFAGDIVQNHRIPFMSSAVVNTGNWLKGLADVAAMKPRFIIPGHGDTSTDPQQAIVFTGDYIRYLRQVMGAAVASWTEFDAAYAAADWRRYEHVPAFAAINRGNAYRVFLEQEKAAFGPSKS